VLPNYYAANGMVDAGRFRFELALGSQRSPEDSVLMPYQQSLDLCKHPVLYQGPCQTALQAKPSSRPSVRHWGECSLQSCVQSTLSCRHSP